MRRSPDIRPDNLLQLALDEIERLKRTKTQTTDGGGGVVVVPGSTVPAPVEGAAHVLYGSKHTNSLRVTDGGALLAAYESGQVQVSAGFFSIVAGTVALTDNATNNIYIDSAGAPTASTAAFPADAVPLAVVTTVSGAITAISDRRAYLFRVAGYSDDQARDAVGAVLTDTATIDFTYAEGADLITADVIQSALDHGSIGGLADDDHTEYALLLGRASGQTLYGGIAAGESLILHSTFHATKGSIKLGSLFEADEANTKIAFFGVTPVVRPSAYTVTNESEDRTYNADSTTIDELADVLGTLINDLIACGLLQ